MTGEVGELDMLQDHLAEHLAPLALNLARLKCLALLLAGLLRHRTVNLTILATENLSGAKNESCYRRFQNFFLKSPLCLISVGRLILNKIPRPERGWVLSLDRTNWKYGARHINILALGIVINNIAIPVAWKALPQATKRGNSNTAQRIGLLASVLRFVGLRESPGGKLRGFEVEVAEEEEDAGAQGLEFRQAARGLFDALDHGVDAFGAGVGAGT